MAFCRDYGMSRRVYQRRRSAAATRFGPQFVDVKALRAKALYDQDASMPIRKSHKSPAIQKIYREFLGEYGSHKAHELLHTKYVGRPKYQ